MAHVSLNIPDADLTRFERVMQENGFKIETDDFEVPEWQQKEVLHILNESKPEDFVSLEEAKAYLFRRRK